MVLCRGEVPGVQCGACHFDHSLQCGAVMKCSIGLTLIKRK
jgi:hypothetical protein